MSMTTLEKARLREREAEIERIQHAERVKAAQAAFEPTPEQVEAWEAAWRQLHGYDKEQSK